MAFIYFISEEYIKQNTGLDDNVDQHLIKPLIMDNQELHIISMLGTSLYDKVTQLLQDNLDNGTPLPTPYDVLINTYIAKVLMFRVMQDVPDAISLKMRNNGVIKQGNESGQAAEIQERQRLINGYERKGDTWQIRFENWICDFKDEIPEYCESQPDGGVYAEKDGFQNGMYIGL